MSAKKIVFGLESRNSLNAQLVTILKRSRKKFSDQNFDSSTFQSGNIAFDENVDPQLRRNRARKHNNNVHFESNPDYEPDVGEQFLSNNFQSTSNTRNGN
jgi:hypothetical protein